MGHRCKMGILTALTRLYSAQKRHAAQKRVKPRRKAGYHETCPVKEKLGQRTPYRVHFTPLSSKCQVQSNKNWGKVRADLDNQPKTDTVGVDNRPTAW